MLTRRRLSWLVAGCLACQMALLAGAPALAAMGLDQDACCQGLAPGQTCPMHQSRAGDRTCKMRSECPRADFALISLLGGLGILPDSTVCVTSFEPGDAVVHRDRSHTFHTRRPESPPPRS
jgi:hypothetical protein